MMRADPRFAANIRFISCFEWAKLKLDRSYGTPEVGQTCTWKAGDIDQFVLQPSVYTDSIGPCSAGGLAGKHTLSDGVGQIKTGMFHLIPTANLTPDAQQIIAQRTLETASQLHDPTSGFICGAHPYRHSMQLARLMVGWVARSLGRTPTYFIGQTNDSWTALGFVGALNSWVVRTQSQQFPFGLNSLEAIRKTFARYRVSPADRVFIGLTSEDPIPHTALVEDRTEDAAV